MNKHVIKICQTDYFELKRISSIRRFLTGDASKTLTSYMNQLQKVVQKMGQCTKRIQLGNITQISEFNDNKKKVTEEKKKKE